MIDQLVLGDEEIANWVKKTKTIDSIVRLPGDASTRKYYRIFSKSSSYIVMRMEPFEDQKDSLPFLVVQKHLCDTGVDVPKILDIDPSRGFILLEDLGDVTLLRRLQEVHSSSIERHLYERVIDSLIRLQVHSSPKSNETHLEAFRLRFDFKKLMWEVNFTIENFYHLYLKRKVSEHDSKIIQDGFIDICNVLASEPTVLTHRDFHSRNIMVSSTSGASASDTSNLDRLVMIDFQDARLGPPQYDLASLLRDSYYQLDETQIGSLLDYYMTQYETMSNQSIDRPHFTMVFDLMSVQRNFKAIGSFASFMNRRGDPGYLKFIGNTFENIRRNLLKYPKYSKLREVLFHYYYF
jgi:aminoglycoside/choline kinase family phosphotransferase